nr:MAG TPA: ATPase [Caudoviricetes sp.]
MDFSLFIRYLQIFGNYKKLRQLGAYENGFFKSISNPLAK